MTEHSEHTEQDAPAEDQTPAQDQSVDPSPQDQHSRALPVSPADVEDLLKEIGEIAADSNLHTLQREIINDRIPSLHNGRITLVVLGEFNHGKSTVVNALLGEDVLPMGITPTTAVITHLIHGKEPHARVKPPMDGAIYDIDVKDIEGVVKHVEESKIEPEYVEIAHPNPFLTNGLVLVDTPGVNDISRQKVEITYGYLPRADVILYVLDATQVLKKSEVTFIKDRLLKANRDRIIFILGKIDALSDDDAREVELYARERLQGLIGNVELYAFSAREALKAQKEGKAPPPAFVQFRDSLTEFLNAQRAFIILDSALAGGMRVAGMLEQNLSIKRQGYLLESDELTKRIEAVHKRLVESRQLISENLDHIDNTVGDIAAAARHNVRSFTNAFAEALPIEIERADAGDIKRFLPQFIQDTFKDWIEKEGTGMAHKLEDLAEEIIEITNASLRETVEGIRDELGMGADLNLEVDTIAYDIGVFALGAFGISVFLFANAIVGGLLTLAAPVLAFFVKDKVDDKIKQQAREEGVKAIRIAGEKLEGEMQRFIHDYGTKLKIFVESAGDRLYRQIEEVLEQVQKERAGTQNQEQLLATVEQRLEATRRINRMLVTSRQKLAEHVGPAK